MKMTFGRSNDPKEELRIMMVCLTIICGCCLLIGFLRNAILCYQLGKDTTGDFGWQILPEGITMVVMINCSVLIFLLLRQVQKQQVFTKLNSNLIMGIGVALECNGLIQKVLGYFVTNGMNNSIYMIYILLGVCFLFIACLFKLGIRMQEEQELTV